MEQLIVIKTLDEFQSLFEYIKYFDYIAYDCETTGLSKDAEMIGFSVCAEVNKAYYVVLSYWSKEEQKLVYLETKERAAEFLNCLKDKQLIMHNAVFDCWKAETNFGVELIQSVHTDTLLLSHILDENRLVGLKELGSLLFGESAKQEEKIMKQSISANGGKTISVKLKELGSLLLGESPKQEEKIMKESISANGGKTSKEGYELYKADCDLIGRYGAKDTILTLKIFYEMVPKLFEEGLDKFFYDDESMPLLRGPTYEMNTTGLRVDATKLQALRGSLEAECLEDKAFIYNEIDKHIKEKYPATKPANTFNINANQQLAWLLFEKLGEPFGTLTDSGKEVCKFFGMRLPYKFKDKRSFIQECKDNAGRVIIPKSVDPITGKRTNGKKVEDFWKYCATDEDVLSQFKDKYRWVKRLLDYKKRTKLLETYVIGIQEALQYNIVRPSFLQHGTTSGRYSSRKPNFQNLPRDDKRIKSCIIARPGKVLVGADYSQLEPRVFASFSGDERLQACFTSGEDFYSVIGMEVFDKYDCIPQKEGSPDAFGVKYKQLRNIAKVVALSSTYGTTANKMAPDIGKSVDEAQEVIDNYFERFPKVKQLMLDSHEQAKKEGKVYNLFGRPRRIPEAKDIERIFPGVSHEELEYRYRTILNLSINHRIQSTGASIMNRAAIKAYNTFKDRAKTDPKWLEVKVLMQVHDELILEGPEALSEEMIKVLKDSMENCVELPGVQLEAVPKAAYNLGDLK